MSVDIKRLSCELIQDYFDFFEQRAFTDNSPYRCYCQVYQMPDEENRKIFNGVKKSDVSLKLLHNGRLSQVYFRDIWLSIIIKLLDGATAMIKPISRFCHPPEIAFTFQSPERRRLWCVLKSLRNGGGAVSLPLYCSRRSMMRKMTDMKLLMDSRKSGKNDMSGIPAVR